MKSGKDLFGRYSVASIVGEFLEKGKIEVLAHLAYSPGPCPCDFSVFGALKWELHNKHFELDVELDYHKLLLSRPFSRRIPQNNDCKMEAGIANDSGYFEKDCGSWWWWRWGQGINFFLPHFY